MLAVTDRNVQYLADHVVVPTYGIQEKENQLLQALIYLVQAESGLQSKNCARLASKPGSWKCAWE